MERENGESDYEWWHKGKWSASGNQITFHYGGDKPYTDSVDYSISGDTLYAGNEILKRTKGIKLGAEVLRDGVIEK